MDGILRDAIAAAGGPTRVAAMFGITLQAVGQWKRCPPERCMKLAAATGGRFTVHDLRPDIFGAAPERKAS